MLKQPNKVTIRDVADEAEVSRSAVSLVLNNGEIRISDEKRKKIIETAKRLGYRPHIGARRLSLMRMETIALVFPYSPAALSQLFLFELTRHVAEQAKERGYDIVIDFFRSSKPETLSSDPGRVDGTILVSDRNSLGNIEHILDDSDHPAIVIGGNFMEHPPRHFVDFDVQKGTREVTQHLIDLGHVRLSFFSAVPSPVKWAGFTEAVYGAGLFVMEPIVLDGDMAEADVEKGLDIMLSQSPRPTGIVAANDTLAIRLIKVLHRKGLRVPLDISVVGFDDIEPASMIIPAVTTVRIPMAKVAEAVMSNLVALIEGKLLDPVQLVLPTELVIRESSAPPASS